MNICKTITFLKNIIYSNKNYLLRYKKAIQKYINPNAVNFCALFRTNTDVEGRIFRDRFPTTTNFHYKFSCEIDKCYRKKILLSKMDSFLN